MNIDDKFTKEEIKVGTVGELIKLLQELPEDLPTSGWPEREVMYMYVTNISLSNPHVVFNMDSPVDD